MSQYLLFFTSFVMLPLEDSGRTQKVTTRADITQQDKKNVLRKQGMEYEGEQSPVRKKRLLVCISASGCKQIKVDRKEWLRNDFVNKIIGSR